MKLNQYPGAIAEAAKNVLILSHRLTVVESALLELDYRFDVAIAFDPELKNDLQRKTQRVAMALQDGPYQQLNRDRVSILQNRDFAILRREQLEREFSVAKLQARREIAELENPCNNSR
jgi:hypothetical protein